MTRWYRAYEGTVTDAKLGEVALVAGCSRSVAIAVWHCILESCATANEKGRFDLTPRRCAVILQEPVTVIEAAFNEMQSLGMIEGDTVCAWQKRQFESDSSTERSRKHRETKRNADATLQQRDATPPYTETDTDTETNTSVAQQTRDELAALEMRLREAAGWQNEPHPGLFVTGAIKALVDSGADLEIDVLPVVRSRAPNVKVRNGWNYFIGPIQDAMATRKAASTGPPRKPGSPAPEKSPSLEQLMAETGWKPGTKYASSTA